MRSLSAASAGAVMILLSACSVLGPGGEGWRITSAGSQPLDEGMVATRSGSGVLLRLTVPDGGANGCGAPRVTAVQRDKDTIVVHVERAPLGLQCLVASDITFDIEVGPQLATGAAFATSNDKCSFAGCTGRPVPIQGG